MKESLRIVTTDGVVLSATRFTPANPDGRVVLISSAVGVKQNFYHPFAAFLAENGFNVYTYDYRGIGASKTGSLRNSHASLHDWGSLDYRSMLQTIFQAHPRSKVVVIGHSIGGQLFGFSSLSAKVDAVVMVGSQTPYWKNYPGAWMKIRLYCFWHLAIPIFTKLFGYFPASALGLFQSLPAEAAKQWARWAKNPDYAFDELPDLRKQFAELRQPALMVSFSDDEIAPDRAVNDLMSRYTNLKWNRWHITPEDIAKKEIGHFGFFRKTMQQTMWREVLEWISKPSQQKERRAA